LLDPETGEGTMLRWALIGASTIGREHMIPAIRSHPGSEIACVVSADAVRANEYAQQNGIPASTTRLQDVLRDASIDAVYISSTNEKHRDQAMAAIGAGKHVLCEKPLAMTVEDATQMVRAAERAGVTFGTNHHLRGAGSHRVIRDMIAAGQIGRVLSLRVHHAVFLPPHLQGWRINDALSGGGVIADITVHDADTVRFLLQDDPVTVTSESAVSGMGEGVEDSVMSVWTMRSGAMVMAHESFTHRYAHTGIEVHGTNGTILARNVMTQQPVGDVELVTEQGRKPIAFSDHDLYTQCVQQFCDAVEGKGTPAATGWDGVKSLAIALAVKQAAETGVRQQINFEGME
jgi:1,5-anhydro-D-fructose reductase (1,5-anhydro-D-mannitol-forming)